MKNEKGFTLVELITVIVVIAIVAVIATRTVTNKINSSKEKAYNIQVNNIKDSAKKYMLENTDEDKYHLDTMCITIAMLQEKGYLEKGNISNPKTNKDFDVNKNYVKVKYNLESNQYEYDFTDDCTEINVVPAAETIISNNDVKITNKADGLYETTDSYVYRGTNPNNYIKFNNGTWRIVSIDKETMMIKIVNLQGTQKQISETELIKDLNDDFENGTTYPQSTKDYINLNSKWNSGSISELDTSTILKSVEKQSNSFNTISLLTVGEYVDASLNKNCYSTNSCSSYLSTNSNYWLLNNTSDNKNWYVTSENKLAYATQSTQLYNVYPCLYLTLNSSIASGNGTAAEPYELQEKN